MKTALLVAFLALILFIQPLSAQVLYQPYQTLLFGVDFRPLFNREAIDFKESQFTKNYDTTKWELSALAFSLYGYKAKYTMTFPMVKTEVITPEKALEIGASKFGNTQKGQQLSSSTTQDPVTVQWNHGLDHRIELYGPYRWPIIPALVMQSCNVTMSVTGKKDGKDTTDFETHNKFFVAGGGMLRTQYGSMTTEIMGAAGNHYTRAQVDLYYSLNRNMALASGYYYDKKDMGPVKVTDSGLNIGLLVGF